MCSKGLRESKLLRKCRITSQNVNAGYQIHLCPALNNIHPSCLLTAPTSCGLSCIEWPAVHSSLVFNTLVHDSRDGSIEALVITDRTRHQNSTIASGRMLPFVVAYTKIYQGRCQRMARSSLRRVTNTSSNGFELKRARQAWHRHVTTCLHQNCT